MHSILTRHGVDVSELTTDAIDVLVTFSPEARRELIIKMKFALPPIVKAAVNVLLEYHRALQVLLQAA